MRALIQRVKTAKVLIEELTVAEIQKGLLLFLGVGKEDRLSDCEKLSQKILKFRIFGDEAGKMNLDVKEAGGEILSVPQFTLYGDTRKGNRPGFDQSAEPAEARVLWVQINTLLRGGGIVVKEGVFGAHMEVALVNEGPVTFWLDSKE